MTGYPDNEKHWAVLSGECVAVLGMMGHKPAAKPEPKTDKKKKTKGKK